MWNHYYYGFKGTVSVISRDPLCKDGNARFKTVPLKLLSNKKCGRYCRFFYSKSVNFCEFLHWFLSFFTFTVRLYSINDKTIIPIGPKFCVGLHLTPEKVNGWSKFQKIASNKIWFELNFWNPRNFFIKSANFLFYNVCEENMFTSELEDECEAPWKHSKQKPQMKINS